MEVVSLKSAYPKTVKPGIPRLADCPDGWRQAPIGAFLEVKKRSVKMAVSYTHLTLPTTPYV